MSSDDSFKAGKKDSVWDSEGGKIAGKIGSGSGIVSEKDALQHAMDALSDAKSLLGTPPQSLSEHLGTDRSHAVCDHSAWRTRDSLQDTCREDWK